MPRLDLVVETKISRSSRARQLEAMFDVPSEEKARLSWTADLPIEERDWNIGLIVGPSGCGKTTCARELFGESFHPELKWKAASVIDDFDKAIPLSEITAACQSVGFNTVPAWMRPHSVLSNGERFRADLARRLLELPDPIVVDEFSSVVDRQVAHIASHAVQKFVRKNKRQFVAVSCHKDVIEWLQPDWVFEPGLSRFRWRSLQRRPTLSVEVGRDDRDTWPLFAPFHYLTANLHRAARCYSLRVNGELAAFAGILNRPSTKRGERIWGISRLVTLPDWQGIGLAFHLCDVLGGAFKPLGYRLRMYPAHPPLIRSYDRSPAWRLTQKPATFRTSVRRNADSSDPEACHAAVLQRAKTRTGSGFRGGRPNAVFEFVGTWPEIDRDDAKALFEGEASAVCDY